MKNKSWAENIRKTTSRAVGFAIWILIVILVISLLRNLGGAGRIKSDIAAEQARLKKMQEDNARLESEVTQAQSQGYIESQIRDKLGLAKEGEAIVVLPDNDTLKKLAPQMPSEIDSLPDPTWKKWLKLFI